MFIFFSCNKKEIVEEKKRIKELETRIEYLEEKIERYKLNTETDNQKDNFLIEKIIFNNDKEAYRKLYASEEFFHNQRRYLFLILNMFLVNDKSNSYDVYQTLSMIYYYELNHELKNSNLYYFTLYFYAFTAIENSIQREENLLESGLIPI